MKDSRVWAEINLAVLRENLSRLRTHLDPNVRVLGVVKADAYGHGAVPVAWTLLDAGAEMLGVGDSNEAIQLRESGITGPILILGAIIEEEIQKVVQYGIATTVHSLDMLKRLNTAAEQYDVKHPVHIKADTGMSRLGASPPHALDIARAVRESTHLELDGFCTHFASASNLDEKVTRDQSEYFRKTLNDIRAEGMNPPMIHAANSVGAMAWPELQYNMVRPGIALYGIDPGAFSSLQKEFEPILTLKTRVAYLKTVPDATPIGYGGTHVTQRATRVATLPIGYNDGFPYRLSNKADVLIHGRRARVIGTVTMDYVMVDVTGHDEVRVGDEVTLIGKSGDDRIRVEDLAAIVETIPYEITCGLGNRVRRVYVK